MPPPTKRPPTILLLHRPLIAKYSFVLHKAKFITVMLHGMGYALYDSKKVFLVSKNEDSCISCCLRRFHISIAHIL